MPTRKILILSVLLVILGALALFTQGPGRRQGTREEIVVFPGLDPSTVRSITVRRQGGELSLSHDGDADWTIGEEGFIADAQIVERLLGDLEKLTVEAVASTSAQKRDLYGVGEREGVNVSLRDGDGNVLEEFTTGKEGPDFFSGYLLKKDAEQVLLVSSNLGSLLSRPLNSWRDRKIVKVAREAVNAVAVRTGDEILTLEKETGDEWFVNARPAGRQAVDDYLDSAVNLRASDFAPEEELSQAGLDEPAAEVVITAGNDTITISIGALDEEKRQHYVRTSESGTIFLVSQYSTEALLKKETDFPPPSENQQVEQAE